MGEKEEMNSHQDKIEEAAEKYMTQDYDGDEVFGAKQSFIEGANFALSMDRWIAVEEGLPEERLKVQVLTKDKIVYTSGIYQSTIFPGETNWFNKHGLPVDAEVTHWQEITPPKGSIGK